MIIIMSILYVFDSKNILNGRQIGLLNLNFNEFRGTLKQVLTQDFSFKEELKIFYLRKVNNFYTCIFTSLSHTNLTIYV